MKLAILQSSLVLACTGFTVASAVPETRSNELADGSYALLTNLLQPGDDAGHDVAIHGRIAVVGAPFQAASHDEGTRPGNAYVCDITTLDPWTNVIDLGTLVPGLDEDADFGWSVATDGHRVVVGAPGQNMNGSVFVFLETVEDGWHLEKKIEPPVDLASPGMEFGYSVAVEGDLLCIGSPEAGPHGLVFAYSATGSFSDPIAVLEPPPPGKINSRFGHDIEIDRILVVGAPDHQHASGNITGAAYVYTYTEGQVFNQEAVLFPPAGFQQGSERFGESVDVSINDEVTYESSIAIGAPCLDPPPDRKGSVHVYRYSKAGWSLEATLQDLDGLHTDQFGAAVSIYKGLIAVGAPGSTATGPNSGHGMVYRYSPTAQFWVQEALIRPVHQTQESRFGTSVCIHEYSAGGMEGTHFVFGAPGMNNWIQDESGLGLVYGQLEDGTWQRDLRRIISVVFEQATIQPTDDAGDSAVTFGQVVAISGNTALVGDPLGTDVTRPLGGTVDTGVVHVLTRSNEHAPWTMGEAPFEIPEDLEEGALFGSDIAIAGDLAIVGAEGQGDHGAAWVYLKSGNEWLPYQELTPPKGDQVTRFGYSVSIASMQGGACFAVGAPGELYDLVNPGKVYLYDYLENKGGGGVAFTQVLSHPDYGGGVTHSSFGTSVDLDINNLDIPRLAVGDPAWPWDDTNQGSVDLYVNNFGWTHSQTLTLSNSVVGFGSSLDLLGSVLVAGAPFSWPSGVAGIFRNTMGLTEDHWELEWVLSDHDSYEDQFGTEVVISLEPPRVIVTSPGKDYLATNAGHAVVFAKDNSGMGHSWAPLYALMASDAQLNDQMRSLAVEGSSILLGCPTDGLDGAGTPRILEFELANMAAWSNHSGAGVLSDNGSWMTPPEDGSTGLFSLLLADPYTVIFDLEEWTGSMQIMLDQVTFILGSGLRGGNSRSIAGSLEIASPPDVKTAVLKMFGGVLEVADEVTVGGTDTAGQLVLSNAEFVVDGVLLLHSSASLSMYLSDANPTRDDDPDDPDDPAHSQIFTIMPPAIQGSLEVDLGEGMTPDDLEAGDRFVLLASMVEPSEGEDRFDVVVLPGLTPDLGFQLQYGFPPGSRGGKEDRGAWEVSIEVVNLADLLDFGDPNTTTVGADAVAVEVVDLTNDGAEEICVIFNDNPGQLVIFENDGAGGVVQQVILNTGDEPVDITSGDFDGDGNQDLAVANHLSQDISVYLNDDADPSNGFTAADFSPGVIPTCLAGFDYLNVDDLDDLVIGYENASGPDGGFIIFAASNPLRGFGFGGQQDLATNGVPTGVDPNEDEEKKDVPFGGVKNTGHAVGGRTSGALAAAGLAIVLDDYAAGVDLHDVVLSDVNGDGLSDLVATSAGNNVIPLLLQDTANPGLFLSALQVPAGIEPGSLATIDFDADGNMDLAVVTTDGGGNRIVRVLQNDGNLSFTSLDLAEGEFPLLVDAGDIDGSGTNDLVTIGDGGSSLRGDAPLMALRATDALCDCPGDADCSGTVDIEDLLAVISDYGCVRDCVADTNGDGSVDIEDVLVVISGWGACS